MHFRGPEPSLRLAAGEDLQRQALAQAARGCVERAGRTAADFELLEAQLHDSAVVGVAAVAELLARIVRDAGTLATALHRRIIDATQIEPFVRVLDPWVMAASAARAMQERPPRTPVAGWAARSLRGPAYGPEPLGEHVDRWLRDTALAHAVQGGVDWLERALVDTLRGRPGARELTVRLTAGAGPLSPLLARSLGGACGRPLRIGLFSDAVPDPDVIIGFGDLDEVADVDALAMLDAVHAALRPGGTFAHVGLPEAGAMAGFAELFLDWPRGGRPAGDTGALLAASAFGTGGRIAGEDGAPIPRLLARRRD